MNKQLFLLAVIAMFATVAVAQSPDFREIEHYRKLPTQFNTADIDSDVVTVTEMFSYSCIHCYNLEPDLKEWKERRAGMVDFEREHVVFSGTGLNLARAFYAAEELGVTEKIHDYMFSAIHVSSLRMNNEELLVRLFEGRGETDEATFRAAFTGFAVENRIRRSDALVRSWRIQGTPTLVVDGRYIAGGTVTRTNKQILTVVDFLVDKVLAERRAMREVGS